MVVTMGGWVPFWRVWLLCVVLVILVIRRWRFGEGSYSLNKVKLSKLLSREVDLSNNTSVPARLARCKFRLISRTVSAGLCPGRLRISYSEDTRTKRVMNQVTPSIERNMMTLTNN